VFERMQCANVPTKISMQFVELVELFEMFTTPTADLAYVSRCSVTLLQHPWCLIRCCSARLILSIGPRSLYRYLLLHCSHGITRIKGTAVSRVVMSAKSAHERMATLLVHPSTDADRAAPDSNTLIANHRSDFTASLFAMWSSGIVPRLTESFDGIVSALFRCVQVFQLLESGELNKQTHSRQFQLKLHTCVYLGAELLRQCFHRHNIARARGLFWSHPRAFSGTEFCIALVDATKNPPPTAERNAKYVPVAPVLSSIRSIARPQSCTHPRLRCAVWLYFRFVLCPHCTSHVSCALGPPGMAVDVWSGSAS
jgi:hypothetical protein